MENHFNLDVKLQTSCFICVKPVFSDSENDRDKFSLEFLLKYLKLFQDLSESVKVCNKCQIILERLSGLGKALEKIQLEMDYLLEVILKEILKADETKLLANGVSQIREEVLVKCGARMRASRPRVTLKRLDSFVAYSQEKRCQSTDSSIINWTPEANSDSNFDGFSGDHEASASPTADVKIYSNSEVEMVSSGNDNQSKNSQTRIKCSKCHLTFREKHSLIRHFKAVHMILTSYKCDLCKRNFARNENKKLHKCKIPSADLLKFPCNICEKSFGYKDLLENHKRFVHTVKKRLVCGTCGMAFKTNQHLNRHVLTTHDKQRFHCKVPGCAKSLSHPDSLERHYKSKHPGFQTSKRIQKPEKVTTLRKNGEVWRECNMCSKRYSSKGGVSNHWKRVHCQGRFSENQQVKDGKLI